MAFPRLPLLLLAAYALAFGRQALGGGLLVVDDHPGQLYRLAHAVAFGPWPWRLNPGWWAGYAELQYYPPGLSYAGAALHAATIGALRVEMVYQVLLWTVYVLPGAATYALLARVLGSAWLALPGAFLALTLSAGSRSGVEEGLRWGLVAARLGWSLLPCLALARARAGAGASLPAAAILAAIAITHPAHAPAGFLLVFLAAWWGPGARSARIARAGLVALVALGLAAFWLVPLLAHLEMALPLAWGDARLAALAGQVAARPLLLVLAGAAGLACWALRRADAAVDATRWLAAFAPAAAALIVLDALVVQPLGILWLPADRLLDSFLLALILGASIALAELRRRSRLPDWGLGIGAVALCVLLASPGLPEPTLTLWPRRPATEWTKEPDLMAGARLDALWDALRQAPPGRILFVRSSVPIAYRPEWWRSHSHITALAPIRAGRDIINGTFTHPSPIAGLVYTGSAAPRPVDRLVERRDGITLFGLPMEALAPDEFDRLAERLRVSVVVALDEDMGRLGFVSDSPAFVPSLRVGPFLVWSARDARPVPPREGPQRWQVPVSPAARDWMPTGLAYSPLWLARAGDRRLDVRRDDLGLLQVKLPPGPPPAIELSHEPGPAEWIGLAVTAISAALGAGWARPRRQSVRRAGRS